MHPFSNLSWFIPGRSDSVMGKFKARGPRGTSHHYTITLVMRLSMQTGVKLSADWKTPTSFGAAYTPSSSRVPPVLLTFDPVIPSGLSAITYPGLPVTTLDLLLKVSSDDTFSTKLPISPDLSLQSWMKKEPKLLNSLIIIISQ